MAAIPGDSGGIEERLGILEVEMLRNQMQLTLK